MASSIRRNTFILQEPSFPAPVITHSNGMDRQNVMRLKVNRIAIIQELRVEHVTGILLKAGVFEPEDLKKIHSGRTPQDKTRILLDLLPTKSKDSGWYKYFREALQNPDASTDIKKRYKLLVDFLDNTVIHRPISQATRFRDFRAQEKVGWSFAPLQGLNEKSNVSKIPHYPTLPHVGRNINEGIDHLKLSDQRAWDEDLWSRTNTEDSVMMLSNDNYENDNMTFVKGFFHQWLPIPNNFRSVLKLSPEHQKRLSESGNPEDQLLLAKEGNALKNIRKVELIVALSQHKQLPTGFELCMCDAVQEILNQAELHHLYQKHLTTLLSPGINLVQDISSSYEILLQMLDNFTMSEMVNQIIQTGLKLATLLTAVNHYSDADTILSKTIHFLKENPSLETWTPRYKAYVKLIQTHNLACQPDKAQSAYFDAVQMQYQINMMSFGQTIVHEGAMHAETSHMLLEFGSIVSALGWAKKALKEVDSDDPAAVVRTLCVAINAYCSHWQVSKAELLSIYVVQYARDKFGERHPMYIEALLHFCHFNSEFKHDDAGLRVAMEVLDAAEKTYGCESIQVALAHCAVSKAMMCMHQLAKDAYYTHAMEAVRIARVILPQGSAQLHLFLHTFASALQRKAHHSLKEVHDSTLHWAEAEAKQAHSLVTETFGEISLKSAQMLLLLGQIYSKMNKHPDIEDLLDIAKRHLKQAVDYLKLCQPPSSNFLLMGMANLGTFYKTLLKPDLAIPMFKFVVDQAESTGWYMKWLHTCFESLAQLYNSMGQDREAEWVQVKLSQWLKANPMTKKPIDCSLLERKPVPFKTFINKAYLWDTAVEKAMTLSAEKELIAMGEGDEVVPLREENDSSNGSGEQEISSEEENDNKSEDQGFSSM